MIPLVGKTEIFNSDQCECKLGFEAKKPPRCNCKNGLCKWSKNKTCLDSSLFIDYEEERDGELIQDVIDMGEPAEPTEPVAEIRDFAAKEGANIITVCSSFVMRQHSQLLQNNCQKT